MLSTIKTWEYFLKLLNYLVRLGWSLGDKEVFTLDELINCFSEGKINSAPSSFSMDKLTWFNKEHLDLLEEDKLLKLLSDNISYLEYRWLFKKSY